MDLPVCVILELPTTVSIVFCYMYVFCVRRNVINRSRNISLEGMCALKRARFFFFLSSTCAMTTTFRAAFARGWPASLSRHGGGGSAAVGLPVHCLRCWIRNTCASGPGLVRQVQCLVAMPAPAGAFLELPGRVLALVALVSGDVPVLHASLAVRLVV